MTEFVVGTGGHGIQARARDDAGVAAVFDTTPTALGALKLSLVAGGADYQFINAAGSELNSGNVSCGTVPGIPTGVAATAGDALGVLDRARRRGWQPDHRVHGQEFARQQVLHHQLAELHGDGSDQRDDLHVRP